MASVNEDPNDPLKPGTVIDGRYRVVRLLGQGGNGVVHEVEHVLTGRHLALKSLLDESGQGRLEQEARAASLMKNPHAVKVTDMGKNAETGPYIVMELLEGHSLRELLEESGQLPVELTANIAMQVCECLVEAHAQGIIHRDLKPDNIHLCPTTTGAGSYDVKVLDFGVVKIQNDGPIPTSSLTRTGSTVGTPFYMSLEQLRSSSNVDARADIYSLCVVLYECLTGTKPFQAETIGDLVYVLCSGPPTALARLRPDVPARAADAIMRGLAINREQRPATMTELAEEMRPFADPTLAAWLRPEAKAAPGPRPRVAVPSIAKTAAFPTPAELSLDPPLLRSSTGEHAASPLSWTPPPVSEARESTPKVLSGDVPHDRSTDSMRAATVLNPREVEAALDGSPLLPDLVRPEPRAKVPATPPVDLGFGGAGPGRSRDTPTEMYQKGFDLDLERHRPELATMELERDAHAPSIADAMTHSPVTLQAAGRPVGRVDQGMLQTLRTPVEPSATSTVAIAPISSPGSDDRGASTSPERAPSAPLAPPKPRPEWQRTLDATLDRIGVQVEELGSSIAEAFRSAPPKQQLALVVIGAGVIGVFMVLILYLNLTR